MTRDELVQNRDAVKLMADIAAEARLSEMKSFMDDMLKKHSMTGFAIECDQYENEQPVFILKITENFGTRDSGKIYGRFRIVLDEQTQCRTIEFTPYHIDYISIDHYEIAFINSLVSMFTFVKDVIQTGNMFINSNEFNSYQADIDELRAANEKIAAFDKAAKDETFNRLQNSFIAGQRLLHDNQVHIILKVTAKRVYVTNYYVHRYKHKSMTKFHAATLILEHGWTLQG